MRELELLSATECGVPPNDALWWLQARLLTASRFCAHFLAFTAAERILELNVPKMTSGWIKLRVSKFMRYRTGKVVSLRARNVSEGLFCLDFAMV